MFGAEVVAMVVAQAARASEEKKKALAAATPHQRILMERQWQHELRKMEEANHLRELEKTRECHQKKDTGPGFMTGLFFGGLFF